jgi:phosphoribosylformylglycinamidine synthase
MDLKESGNLLYLVGETRVELGGSHFTRVNDLDGGQVPMVNPAQAREIFAAIHRAIGSGLVRSCHDLSEGGLAAAAAEMAFAGGLGARLDVAAIASSPSLNDVARLFSESNTRFLCEVRPNNAAAFEQVFANLPVAKIGRVDQSPRLVIQAGVKSLIDADIFELKEAWQAPLRW